MLGTTLDHIRNVCKDICCIYMRQDQPLSSGTQSNKKHKK